MGESKIKGLLQLANRAGRLSFGMEATKKCILQNKVYGLILATGLAERSKSNLKKLKNEKSRFWIYEGIDMEEISEILNRNSLGIVGILDVNFAKGINKKLEIKNGGRLEQRN